jgi:hypothetical protein
MGPMLDSTKLLSGHPASDQLPEIPKGVVGPNGWGALASNDLTAWAGPWGVSFSYNLTPDMKTGIGGWTEDMFIKRYAKGNLWDLRGTFSLQCRSKTDEESSIELARFSRPAVLQRDSGGTSSRELSRREFYGPFNALRTDWSCSGLPMTTSVSPLSRIMLWGGLK